jgi:hypothetical protein
MRFSKNLLLATLAAVGGGGTTTARAQALSEQVVERFDSVDKVQFVSGDWNPADGDTTWLTRTLANSVNGADPNVLEFAGLALTASFSASTDPWETVSIQSLPGRLLVLADTAEFQLLLKPNYQSDRTTVSVLLRLTMQDGSMWDQTKVVRNGVWQRAAFPVSTGDFARVSWGPTGQFNLSTVASWQVIFVDLPAGQHSVELHALHAKRPIDTAPPTAEAFDTRFFSYGGAVANTQSNILFRRGDWNANDGDTDWLYHRHKVSTSYSPSSYLQASYRSAADPWETVSIRKDAQTRFELAGAKQIVARLSAERNLDPNALVLSLTMQDGSVWQQGRALDAVSNLGYVPGNSVGVPYHFPIDAAGRGWNRAEWGPFGYFNLDRVRSWELYFNNLGSGVHEVLIQGVELSALSSASAAIDATLQASGQARIVAQQLAAADGARATIAASGAVSDQVALQGTASAAAGFLVEVTSSYANNATDAALFRLSASDGETRELRFALPQAGRSLMRIHTSCPGLPPGTMVRGPAEMDARCQSLQGAFYGMDLAKFDRWELRLQSIPAGEHSVKLAVFPQVE